MTRIYRYLFSAAFFLVVSTSNLSGLCKHGFASNTFRYTGVTPSSEKVDSIKEVRGDAEKVTWETLADVNFKTKFNKQYQMDFMYPVFGKLTKPLNKKELSITGYMIPLNVKQGLYAISRNPYAACFFCGQSGPESVISLKFAVKPRRYKTDEFLTMKGTMELNDTNVNDFIYIFQQTEEVK